MAKRTKNEKRAKRRKEIRKRQKAKKTSLPALLRQEPLLLEALNYHHPLVTCLINENWREHRMASIYVIRDAPTGFVFSGFLVDLAGLGLKDAWGNYGLSEAEIERLKLKASANDDTLIPCEPSVANTIVHGGITWAKKWNFRLPKEHKIWLRLLEPVNQNRVDVELFGENGKPFLVLSENDLDAFYEEAFDPKILETDLQVKKDGLQSDTLMRMGDIKGALINFSRRSEFREDFESALIERFGKPERPDSRGEWIDFQDRFTLEHNLERGGTIPERFVKHYKGVISNDVRELVLGWRNVIEGLFEVKGRYNNRLLMKSLINERDYEVFPTASMDDFQIDPGDFITARIVPAKGFHIFSGAVVTTESDGSEDFRAKMYKMAVDFQMKHPRLAFKDNKEKLNKSLESVRSQYEDFLNYFGSAEVIGTGNEILEKYQKFFDYRIFEKKDSNTGRTVAVDYENKTGKPYHGLKVELPESVLHSRDVGMLCDPVEGFLFLIDYGHFSDIFQNPEQHLWGEKTEEFILDYLESDSVSDIPFRRVAERLPHNFCYVMAHCLDREGLSADSIDDLMMEFKPYSFDKVPGIVTIFDAEMGRLARLAEESK